MDSGRLWLAAVGWLCGYCGWLYRCLLVGRTRPRLPNSKEDENDRCARSAHKKINQQQDEGLYKYACQRLNYQQRRDDCGEKREPSVDVGGCPSHSSWSLVVVDVVWLVVEGNEVVDGAEDWIRGVCQYHPSLPSWKVHSPETGRTDRPITSQSTPMTRKKNNKQKEENHSWNEIKPEKKGMKKTPSLRMEYQQIKIKLTFTLKRM